MRVLYVDCSAAMGPKQQSLVNKARLHFKPDKEFYFDVEVHETPTGRGGSDIRCVPEHAEKIKATSAVVICDRFVMGLLVRPERPLTRVDLSYIVLDD